MQNAIAFHISRADLVAGEGSASRYAYESRFVPLNFQSAAGESFSSGWQTARAIAWKGSTEAAQAPPSFSRSNMTRRLALTLGAGTGSPGFGSYNWRDEQALQQAHAASELGVLFLERTRIHPTGFCLGEHVFSLSLGPGEEVVIEQKTFSERQTTFEETADRTQERQDEFSSTLTAELSNSLARTVSENQTTGFSIGGSLSGEYKGVKLSVDASYSDTVTQADQTTRESSARNAQSSTSKVAGLLRSQHKTTFRVSETNRYESGSRRTLRNPNPHTPIDLVYFKIMQKFVVSQERFGARLCWAPAVKSPGTLKAQMIESAQQRFYDAALASLRLPVEPVRPTGPNGVVAAPVTTVDYELTQWNLPWGDMRADYTIPVAIPAGLAWDGDVAAVQASISFKTTGWSPRGTPGVNVFGVRNNGGGVDVLLHAGAQAGFAGAHLYATFSVNTVPSAGYVDPAYKQALDDWTAAHTKWAAAVVAAKDTARATAKAQFDAWVAEFEKRFDPVQALMQAFIRVGFPPSATDEFGEVAYWSNIFDFSNAVVRTYPSWWSSSPAVDPTKEPDSIENASWARLFLPIRIGHETQALRWLYARGAALGPPDLEAAIRSTVDDLVDYRTTHFGGAQEVDAQPPLAGSTCPRIERPYLCLGRWEEQLATDGTHLEVLQASTTAMDTASQLVADDAHAIAVARSALTDAQVDLTRGAGGRANMDVSLNVGTPN